MMGLSAGIFALLFLVTTTVANKCPTGCSCKGSATLELHTAICHKEPGPRKDFPPTIKTLEIRNLPISSMRQFLKHAPDVTDLIIHGFLSENAQSLPADFFFGMKHLKALTFRTFKHETFPHGLAAALNGLKKLRFLDLSRNQLECSCDLPHWIRQHHVTLLGLRSLSPSTKCKEKGFEKDFYKAQELFDFCEHEKHTKRKPQPTRATGKHLTTEKATAPSKAEQDEILRSTVQENEEAIPTPARMDRKEDPQEVKIKEGEDDGDLEEEEQESELYYADGEEDEEDEKNDKVDKEKGENNKFDGEKEESSLDEKHSLADNETATLKDILREKSIRDLVIPAVSRPKEKDQKSGGIVPFLWDRKGPRYNPTAPEMLEVTKKSPESISLIDATTPELYQVTADPYQSLMHSLLAVRKIVNSISAKELENVRTQTLLKDLSSPSASSSATPSTDIPWDNSEMDTVVDYYDTDSEPDQPKLETKTLQGHSLDSLTNLATLAEARQTTPPAAGLSEVPHAENPDKSRTGDRQSQLVSDTDHPFFSNLNASISAVRDDKTKELLTKQNLLAKLSADGLSSSVPDSPVDIKLHPLDPFEMRLLTEYLRHVSGRSLN